MAKRKKKARAKSNTYVSSSYTEPDTADFEQEEEILSRLDEADETSELFSTDLAVDLETSKSWRFALSEGEITDILLKGKFGNLKLIPWGSNYTFIAPLCIEPTGQEYAVIYKPMRGEAPLWDFPSGTLYKREYCAYLVARALGWHFIPPVVVRDGPHGIGTVQLFVDVDERQQYYEFQEYHAHELKRIAIFDFITNNADRKAGHCLLGANNLVWAIDHGICFNHVPKLRTVIWDFAGQPIPDDICQDLAELATNSARFNPLISQLREWLDRHEVELFLERLEYVLQHPQFPGMNSRRQIPWGFF
jgi:uncharacterized repeat protein (TIGR03843 family)